MSILSGMQYSHWLMVAGAVLVVLGFVGLAFRRNGNAEADREVTEVKANRKGARAEGKTGGIERAQGQEVR